MMKHYVNDLETDSDIKSIPGIFFQIIFDRMTEVYNLPIFKIPTNSEIY